MIPAQAVEAALSALFPNEPDITAFKSDFWQPTIQTILEAAAPHLLVGAWEEGKDAVWTFLGNQDPRRERPANPYGSTK